MKNKIHQMDLVLKNLILICFAIDYIELVIQFPNCFYKWWTIVLGASIIINAGYEIIKERMRG